MEVTMIADMDPSPFEEAVKIITIPLWVPLYLAYCGCVRLGRVLSAGKARALEGEILEPRREVWVPKSDVERAVFAAIVLAGGPVTNAQLAKLMGVSKGEASRRVSQLAGVICKERIGREVRISIPSYLH